MDWIIVLKLTMYIVHPTLFNISPPLKSSHHKVFPQLTSLPPLSSLTSLKLLDVSLNLLSSLPDMGQLANLETLNLSLNKVGLSVF